MWLTGGLSGSRFFLGEFMSCYFPINGWRSRESEASGKRRIVFVKSQGYEDQPVTVPCGKCVGCRLDRSRAWAVRMSHEASMHECNAFITLTYSDDHLPRDLSLNINHFQLFMKRFRMEISPLRVKFFHCGEYGDRTERPIIANIIA